MSTLTIRNVDPAIKDGFRARAAKNGRPMEAEARAMLTESVSEPGPSADLNLYDRIRSRIEPLGGVDLELPSRAAMRKSPAFE